MYFIINNPKIKGVKTTNIFKETNIKMRKDLIVKKIINSYEIFFSKINKYNFLEYKNKANLFSINPSDLL